MDKWS